MAIASCTVFRAMQERLVDMSLCPSVCSGAPILTEADFVVAEDYETIINNETLSQQAHTLEIERESKLRRVLLVLVNSIIIIVIIVVLVDVFIRCEVRFWTNLTHRFWTKVILAYSVLVSGTFMCRSSCCVFWLLLTVFS